MPTVDSYLKAKAIFETAREDYFSLVFRAGKLLAALENLAEVSISDRGCILGGSPRNAGTVEAEHWPTIHRIDAALSSYKSAEGELHNAWQALTGGERDHLQALSPDMLMFRNFHRYHEERYHEERERKAREQGK